MERRFLRRQVAQKQQQTLPGTRNAKVLLAWIQLLRDGKICHFNPAETISGNARSRIDAV
jgi:hypothetical protein